MKKAPTTFFFIFLVVISLLATYFFVGVAPTQKNIAWGVDFSQMQSEALQLDWKQNYLAIIEDLKVKNIKLHTQWDFLENRKNNYFFGDTDWQIHQAQNHGVGIIYVVGLKTGRWPECHIPDWANSLPKQEQQDNILSYIKETVLRYKNNKAIVAWQAENEPLFRFGECPAWYYNNADFLKEEVMLIKSLDPMRPVIISDTGEYSFWFKAARIGDIVGITTYRSSWVHISDNIGFYFNSWLPPVFYWRKAQVVKGLFGKDVIVIELQAEPWASKPVFDVSLQEQEKSMNLAQFQSNVIYAQKTGLKEFYFWGTEWWYWLREKQNKPEIWNEAKKLFVN